MKILTSFIEGSQGETTSHEMAVTVVADEVVVRSSADSELQLLLNIQRKLKYAKANTELAIESFERKLAECCSKLESMTALEAIGDETVELVHIPDGRRFSCTTTFLKQEIERENLDPNAMVHVISRGGK